jgi:hypothetical protein
MQVPRGVDIPDHQITIFVRMGRLDQISFHKTSKEDQNKIKIIVFSITPDNRKSRGGLVRNSFEYSLD